MDPILFTNVCFISGPMHAPCIQLIGIKLGCVIWIFEPDKADEADSKVDSSSKAGASPSGFSAPSCVSEIGRGIRDLSLSESKDIKADEEKSLASDVRSSPAQSSHALK